MPSELEELVGFLHHERAEVVQIALDNLVGYSTGAHQQVFSYDDYTAIKDLKSLARSKGRTTVNQAVTILANLCDDIAMRNLIVEDLDFFKYLVSSIVDISNANADIMCILLTNLAKNDSVNKIFDFTIQHTTDEQKANFKSERAMDCLMDCFVKGSERTLNKAAEYDYLSYFFADISRFLQGRDYFITEQEYDGVVPISKLLVFTEFYDSRIRREGVAKTIKNSLFDSSKHWVLVTDPKINILPYILLPIAGPEDIDDDDMFNLPEELQLLDADKKRDPNEGIICTHLESLLLLCTTRKLREYLREKSVYAIVKVLHNAYNSELIADLCDRVVQMLMRDEAPEDLDAMEEESDEEDDKIIEVL